MTKPISSHAIEGSFVTEIKQGNHTIIADEPTDLGGTDKGMNPYGLLSSALAACTSMTLQMYATRKKWDIKEINVTVEHTKDYVNDCTNCENKEVRLDFFKRNISIKGNLDNDQKARLLEIANKCPVHKTLHSEIRVETKLIKVLK